MARGLSSQTDSDLRVVNWNIEWARPDSRRGRTILRRIWELRPHVVCLTESHDDFFATGHVIVSEPDYGYGNHRTRRKVVLWSEQPWSEVDALGNELLPTGRFIAGTTKTPLGTIRFIGVCIPWKDAHVRTGRKDRQSWQDHAAYLECLSAIVDSSHQYERLLLGDFNQTIPRSRAPKHVFERLQRTLRSVECATSGILEGAPTQSIDHICHSRRLACSRRLVLSNVDIDGRQLSDHFGISADYRINSPEIS